MKFLSVNEFTTNSAIVWKELHKQKDMIITSNGKPIAILSSINEDNFEQDLSSFRQARAMQAVNSIQMKSVYKGTDKISTDEIDDEIKAVRLRRR